MNKLFSELKPIEKEIELTSYSSEKIGGKIQKHTQKDGIPNLENIQIVIITLDDLGISSHMFRHFFYDLYSGNWNFNIADLGILPLNAENEDILKNLISELMLLNIIPIVLGKNQNTTYTLYRAFDSMEHLVNLVCIDSVFDFGDSTNFISQQSYMNRILTQEPFNLSNYSNLGYQTYYNPPQILDMLKKMHFEYYRLGEVTKHLEFAEPILRDAHLVSIDLNCVQACDLDWEYGRVNGFSNREICALSRYAGLGMHIASLGIFEIPTSRRSSELLSQIIWYFIEGFSGQIKEYPNADNNKFFKYIVPFDNDLTIEFYKSKLTQRWWMLPEKNTQGLSTISCNEQDYIEACQRIIPKRWISLHSKTI